jgi:hypothetical protein
MYAKWPSKSLINEPKRDASWVNTKLVYGKKVQAVNLNNSGQPNCCHGYVLTPRVLVPRALQEEYERLKAIRDDEHPSEGDSSPGTKARDAELLTEAKLLRQHKGRLEARMQVLEDHNRQLEAQLQRLRQLLDQPNQENRNPPSYSRGTTPASSASSLGDPPYGTGRSARSPRPRGLESDTESDHGRNASPVETRKSE